MEFSVSIIEIFLLLGALQGLFLSILLFTKYNNHLANKYLGFLILFFSLFVFNFFYSSIDSVIQNYPHTIVMFGGLPFLFGPLHLIYIGELTDSQFKFDRFHWLHFLPFILYKLYYLQAHFISADELSTIIMQIGQNILPLHIIASNVIVAIIGLLYMIKAIGVFKRYYEKIRNTFSSLDKINLKWLRFFTFVALFVWSIVFIRSGLLLVDITWDFLALLVPVLTSFFIYAIGYIGMFNTEIFVQPNISENISQAKELAIELEEIKSPVQGEVQKYRKSGLTEEKAEEYLQKIKSLMEKEQIYTDPDITLRDLSVKIGTSIHNISEVINTRLNQNFFDFINHYRLQKVKEDLVDKSKDHLTLFGIAIDAGFNSKSGFNAIFKRYTGKTPSEYRRQIEDQKRSGP
jgi:AraC-like DNA-binding protein